MTTQLSSEERSDPELGSHSPEILFEQSPEVLFEEARRRRRRRWMAGGVLSGLAVVVGALIFGAGGGGAGGSGSQVRGHAPKPRSGAGHLTAGRLFASVPATQGFYTGPGAPCQLAPRNKYLPARSGCVSAAVADLLGNGRPDLVLTYSLLGHVPMTPRGGGVKRYEAKKSMLRVVTPDGQTITAPIEYWSTPFKRTPAQLVKADAAALISVAHVSNEPGKVIFLQTGQLSSGTNALAYTLHHGRLVSSGVVLGYRGDGGTQANFQCQAGNPPLLTEHSYELIQVIHGPSYGWWNETTTTYAWHGPRLVKIVQHTIKRRIRPRDSVGVGCKTGIT